MDGSSEYPDKKYGLELPQIPQQNLQMFEAASMADVFGAMGSWNDSPPYMAHKKGLDKEYEILSADLLKNIMLSFDLDLLDERERDIFSLFSSH